MLHRQMYSLIFRLKSTAKVQTFPDMDKKNFAIAEINRDGKEQNELSYLADILPESHSSYIKKHHPKAKRYNIKHGTWCVIFHVDGAFVMVDRIVLSSSVTD